MLRTHVHQMHRRSRGRSSAPWPPAGTVFIAVLLVSALLDACGSSSSASSSVDVKRTCVEVEAMLSDGPEPAADPVGYAQAQVLPLHEIHTSDPKLRETIDRLASAYATESAEGRVQPSAESEVSAAVAALDDICPGAAS